jgi:primosomal protein N' (replication factor Y) (superfamily II helicase)
MKQIWKVAVNAPLREALTYASPDDESLAGSLCRGMSVTVPLGTRATTGVILGPGVPSSKYDLKAIRSINSEYPILPEFYTQWLEWVASYYLHAPGLVVASTFPPLDKKTSTRKSKRPPVVAAPQASERPTLTEEQTQVLRQIQNKSGFATHLLFGVTGSGKTEIYLQLLEKVLLDGKRGLVLVPEISLTPQLVQRFANRFGEQIAVLHSQLTDRERTNQWWDVVTDQKKILIGARSALFCPLHDLDLIIVDEEHEPSFKQEEKLKYHARDSAVMLAKFAGCPIVLGSATPSLESWKNALDGRYHLHKMQKRVEDRSLPEVQIIDIRSLKKSQGDLPPWMHPQLFEAIHETLAKKEQVALFLNRRGTANIVVCPACGFTHECPNCDITLTLHGRHHLVCHYCDYHEPAKQICPDCKEGEMTPLGVGTEKVEEDIRALFPQHNIARADRDEIQNRADLEELISKMENRDIDILIGTQMIAKGLDFKHLTLVGLVLADVGFNLPDFRATERSFQLITQVSGRAGRHIVPGERPGQVLIQTLNPDHVSLQYSIKADYEGFAKQELAAREQLHYPPLGKLASVRIQGVRLDRVQDTAKILSNRAQQLKTTSSHYRNVEILGPAEAPLAKLRGQYRYHLLLKDLSAKSLNPFCHQLLGDQDWVPAGTRVSVDVDPLHLL